MIESQTCSKSCNSSSVSVTITIDELRYLYSKISEFNEKIKFLEQENFSLKKILQVHSISLDV